MSAALAVAVFTAAYLLTATEKVNRVADRPLLVRALLVLTLVTVAFALHGLLHYQPSVVALLGAGL